LEYGARIINLVESLPNTLVGRRVADQLLRCGTSAGANYEEARGAESKEDFVHKLQIALKELRESNYWLRLLVRSGKIPQSVWPTCWMNRTSYVPCFRNLSPPPKERPRKRVLVIRPSSQRPLSDTSEYLRNKAKNKSKVKAQIAKRKSRNLEQPRNPQLGLSYLALRL
jgi:four helix bundle protein